MNRIVNLSLVLCFMKVWRCCGNMSYGEFLKKWASADCKGFNGEHFDILKQDQPQVGLYRCEIHDKDNNHKHQYVMKILLDDEERAEQKPAIDMIKKIENRSRNDQIRYPRMLECLNIKIY